MESAADTEFDYLVPEELWPIQVGQRVDAPFGKKNKIETGFCVLADVPREKSFAGGKDGGKLKSIARKADEEPLLGPQLMELAFWISEYYVCPLGQVLAAMIPGAVKRAAGIKTRRCVYLGVAWEEMIGTLKGAKQKRIVEILRERQALVPDAAVDADELLEAADCGSAVLKKLADEQVVRVVKKKSVRRSAGAAGDARGGERDSQGHRAQRRSASCPGACRRAGPDRAVRRDLACTA